MRFSSSSVPFWHLSVSWGEGNHLGGLPIATRERALPCYSSSGTSSGCKQTTSDVRPPGVRPRLLFWWAHLDPAPVLLGECLDGVSYGLGVIEHRPATVTALFREDVPA
jgi:hypothetical protein